MKNILKSFLLTCAFIGAPFTNIFAQTKASLKFSESELSEPVALVLISIIILLLFVIIVLGNAVRFLPTVKPNLKNTSSINKATTIAILLGIASLTAFPSFAQEAEVAEAAANTFSMGPTMIGGISATSFYVLFGIILLELAAIFMILFTMRSLLNPSSNRKKVEASTEKGKKRTVNQKYAWFEKLNNTKSIDSDSEAEIDLGHDYDGIRELDNPTPPWWKWGFRLSVVFGFVYMWVYFVSGTAPLQLEELAIANEKAEIAKAKYLANSANNIDENTVTILTDASDLSAGQSLYINNCAACHLDDGGGMIGPNLADKYWLHGGKINDIFKSIKYGIPGTGMKAWENDFSPKQIAQISSFVHSLQGTTPKTAKEPEGELMGDAEATTAATEAETTENE